MTAIRTGLIAFNDYALQPFGFRYYGLYPVNAFLSLIGLHDALFHGNLGHYLVNTVQIGLFLSLPILGVLLIESMLVTAFLKSEQIKVALEGHQLRTKRIAVFASFLGEGGWLYMALLLNMLGLLYTQPWYALVALVLAFIGSNAAASIVGQTPYARIVRNSITFFRAKGYR